MPSQMSRPRSNLKPQEAALLAGEIKKPSWQSKNEGIHERVSFEDSIWGFDLAGGSFYKTPLRVTAVKSDSRAEKAGIRPGDKLLRINDIDTSTLTIQEAHEIIIDSGVHLRLAVTAPEDEEDSYHCWEDQIEDGYDSEEERRLQREKEEKRQVHCKVSSYWSLQWPWVSKRRVIYRESNCFMVPSKYEGKHREKFEPLPSLKTTDDVVLFGNKNEENLKYRTGKTPPQSPLTNGVNENKPNFPTGNCNNARQPKDKKTLDKLDEEVLEQVSESEQNVSDMKQNENFEKKYEESIEVSDIEDNVEHTSLHQNGIEEKNENSIEVSDLEDNTEDSIVSLNQNGNENMHKELKEVSDFEDNDDINSNQNGNVIDEKLKEFTNVEQNNEVIQDILEKSDEIFAQDDEERIINDILSDNSEISESINTDKT